MKDKGFWLPGWRRSTALLSGAAGILYFSISKISSQLGLVLDAPWGWVNFAVAAWLISWFAEDAIFSYRSVDASVYRDEAWLKKLLRPYRGLFLLTSAFLAIASALLVRSDFPAVGKIPASSATPLVVLVSAFLATWGWMYTRFQQESAERSRETLEAIRDQLYGGSVSVIYLQMRAMCDFYRRENEIGKSDHLPKKAMEMRIDSMDDLSRPAGKGSISLGFVTDHFFNALNQIALGVRRGQLDLETINYVLRPRFVRHAFLFFEYIVEVTDAEPVPERGRWRARKRTWEHLLWLVNKLDILESDCVDLARIVLPPDHVIGSRRAELVDPNSKCEIFQIEKGGGTP